MASTSTPHPPETHYTVFIRLPFNRGDFVDPPPADWNAAKDRALWKVLSRSSGGSDVQCKERAVRGRPFILHVAYSTLGRADDFQVSLPFLLQQAAWLYERQLSQVRAQMRKVGHSTPSTAPSPIPGSVTGSTAAGGQPMRRGGSSGAGPRAPSALSMRSRDSPALKGDTSLPGTPNRSAPPPMSRTSSANTTPQARQVSSASPRQALTYSRRTSYLPQAKEETLLEHRKGSDDQRDRAASTPSNHDSSSGNTSSSESERGQGTLRSQAFKRPPILSLKSPRDSFNDSDGDEDDSPAFLPFSHDPTSPHPGGRTAQHRQISRPQPHQRHPIQQRPRGHEPHKPLPTAPSSTSSASSHAPQPSDQTHSPRTGGPLSPRRTAELAGRSPQAKGKGREGSDGTPSMGSSFSDLDDTSVTQSALEEALLSNMQTGAVASRMSSISQALRSRYM